MPAAAHGKQRFLVSMECVETGNRIEQYIDAEARSDALGKFLRRSAVVVALMSERQTFRFTVAGTNTPGAAHMFAPVIRMDPKGKAGQQ